jgi:hypothetical protein
MSLPPHPPFNVSPAEPGERVFRLLEGAEPSIQDFVTDEQSEKTENLARSGSMAIYRGISVRRTLPQARRVARQLRRGFVAELELTWRDGDAIARTFKTPGHHTLWGHPDLLLSRVVDIHSTADD